MNYEKIHFWCGLLNYIHRKFDHLFKKNLIFIQINTDEINIGAHIEMMYGNYLKALPIMNNDKVEK